jgi:hypothetical protein
VCHFSAVIVGWREHCNKNSDDEASKVPAESCEVKTPCQPSLSGLEDTAVEVKIEFANLGMVW